MELVNRPLTQFRAYRSTLEGREFLLFKDPESDLTVIHNYAPGRSLIFRADKLAHLATLPPEGLAGHPDLKASLVSNNDLQEHSPFELYTGTFPTEAPAPGQQEEPETAPRAQPDVNQFEEGM